MGRADSELVGDIAQFTALALLVFHLTGSGLGVSGVVVAEIVPVLLLARWSPLLWGIKRTFHI